MATQKKTDYRFMQVKSIAECSKGSILQYFWPSLSYTLSLRSVFIFVYLETGFTVTKKSLYLLRQVVRTCVFTYTNDPAITMHRHCFSTFVLMIYVPVNNFWVMSGQFYLCRTSTKQQIKRLAQGHNTVTPPEVSLELHVATLWSPV